MLSSLRFDARDALRALVAAPQVTIVCVLTLALGIAATTAIFSVLDGVLLRPLPYRDPDRLVMVWEKKPSLGAFTNSVSPGNFIRWAERNKVFTGMAAVSLTFRTTLTGAGAPAELPLQLVSHGFLSLLGARPALGRDFLPQEDRRGSGVTIISYRVWQERFGGDQHVLDRPVLLNGQPTRIVGIMPRGFSFLDSTVDVWAPIGFGEESRTPQGRWITVVARLRAGVQLAQAQAAMDVIAAGLAREFPQFDTGWGINVVPLQEQVVGGVRRAILVLSAAVVLLLLMASVNAAGLQLARATAREREIAVRAALGARPARIARQLLTESTLLATAAATLGVATAWWALRGLVYLAGDSAAIPRLDELAIDRRILTGTLGIATATAAIVGLAPMLGAVRRDTAATLTSASRTGTARATARVRQLLGVAQVALAVLLLIAAGLVTRSVHRLLSVDTGFATEQVMTFRLAIPDWKHDTPPKRIAALERLLASIAAQPGVRSAGAINFLPMAGLGSATSYEALGRPKPPLGQELVADVRVVSGDYFRTMGIPLLEGRLFTDRDRGDAANVIVINQTMARRTWPGESAIGQRVKVAWTGEGLADVIGIVADVRPERLDGEIRAMLYWPHAYDPWSAMTVVARTAMSPESLARSVQQVVSGIDPDVAVSDVRSMDAVLARSIATRRLTMSLLVAFGSVALALAAAGLYALLSYSVAMRRRDIGIRVALGAASRHIRGWVLAQATRVVAPGIGVGLLLGWLLARYSRDLLFGIRPADPLTFAATAVVLSAVALVAAWVPARTASRVDPVETLRSE
jgi:putative ABC transport system permease protein